MASDGDGLGAKTRWVDVNGIWVHCLTAGGVGSTVVLLHGGGIDSASFTYGHLIGPLAEGRSVFAPDWPGYGHSDKPNLDSLFKSLACSQRQLETVGKLSTSSPYIRGLGAARFWACVGRMLISKRVRYR
jgi:pimeloyl-ACP methyl ester carboxylesterase